MQDLSIDGIDFVEADAAVVTRVEAEWGRRAARGMHVDDGFSIVAIHAGKIVGLISVGWGQLPAPLPATREGYVDNVEVLESHRRRGIARKLVDLAARRAGEHGAYQVRAWSTDDKKEAIPMWKALGFALCPVTHSLWGPEITGYFVAKRLG